MFESMTTKWASAWQPQGSGEQSPLDKIRRELAETRIDVAAVHSSATVHSNSSSSGGSDHRRGDDKVSHHSPSKWQGGQIAKEMIRQQREVMFEEEDQEDEEQQHEEYEQDVNEHRYEDDASSALDDCHERRVVSVRSAVGSMSYYTDPSVPLSLFLIDGVLPQRHDDDDDIAGGMGQETSGDSQYPRQQGYRKSPLEVTLSPPKPLVNPTTRYTPIVDLLSDSLSLISFIPLPLKQPRTNLSSIIFITLSFCNSSILIPLLSLSHYLAHSFCRCCLTLSQSLTAIYLSFSISVTAVGLPSIRAVRRGV